MIEVKVRDAYGKYKPTVFKNVSELKSNIEFDGQTFWLGSETLGEISPDLAWDWKKLTPEKVSKEKDIFVKYILETKSLSSKKLKKVM